MKYFIISILLCFCLISCQSGCGNSNNPGSNSQNSSENLGGLGTTESSPKTPEEQRVFGFYTTDFWVITGYHKIKLKGGNKKNRGRWYQFRPDGTFTVGHFDKTLSSGTWRLEKNGTHVRLDAIDDTEDGLWRMQLQSDGSQMVWVGTEEFKTTGVQQRLENLLFTPKNPGEMGWEN